MPKWTIIGGYTPIFLGSCSYSYLLRGAHKSVNAYLKFPHRLAVPIFRYPSLKYKFMSYEMKY